MDEYINKKEVLQLLNDWWRTTVYVSSEPTVAKQIKALPTIKVDDGCCPECGFDLENAESEGEHG